MLNLVFDQHSINLYDDDNDDDAECIYIYIYILSLCQCSIHARYRCFLLDIVTMTGVEMSSDTDGIYGLVPQRVIDEEDEKLRAWKQDADLVSVNPVISSFVLLDVTANGTVAVIFY